MEPTASGRLLGLIVALALFPACKHGDSASQSLEWTGGLSGGAYSSTGKTSVLVWYGNETGRASGDAVDMNDWKSKRIAEILNGAAAAGNQPAAETAYLRGLADKFQQDRDAFADAALKDSSYFDDDAQPCRLANHFGIPTALFSNRETLRTIPVPGIDNRAKWQYCEPTADKPTRFVSHTKVWDGRKFRPEGMYQPLYSNPLADARAFALALSEVAAVFPPDRYEYVLVTKSHGSSSMALGVMINVDVGALNEAAFIASLLAYARDNGLIAGENSGVGHPDGNPLGATKPDGSPLGATKPDGSPLGATKPDGSPLGTEATAYLAALNASASKAAGLAGDGGPTAFGTTKTSYFQVLAQAGAAQKMGFPMVVMESCNGRAGLEAAMGRSNGSSENIGVVYSSDAAGLNYTGNIDWDGLLATSGTDIRAALSEQLDRRAQTAVSAHD